MFKRLLGLSLTFGMAATAPPALAAACAPRGAVVEKLQETYSEQLTMGGLQHTSPVQTMIEIWSSPDTGTFTVLITNPNGVSCVISSGSDFFTKMPEPDSTGVKG